MIEEKDVLAMVRFKAQIDVPNGTTFLRCDDLVYKPLFKNGTVVTGLLKQQARILDAFTDSKDFTLFTEINAITEPIRDICYSKALMMVKKGFRITRAGWNAENQWIRYINPYAPHPDHYPECKDTSLLNPYFKSADNNELAEGTMVPYLAIKTNNNQLVPWLPSQTDNLAEDWIVLPK